MKVKAATKAPRGTRVIPISQLFLCSQSGSAQNPIAPFSRSILVWGRH